MFNINNVIKRTLIYFPIFKILINNINFVERTNINTACTNGNTIYYNSSFFQSLQKNEQVFVIAHELMHITLKHISRLEQRDTEIWNYATDAIINQILKNNNLPLPKGVIDCPDALSYSAEEYYEIIKNKPDCEQIMANYRNEKQEKMIASHEYWNKEQEEKITEKISDINENNITEINKKLIHNDNQDYIDNIENAMSKTKQTIKTPDKKSSIDWKTYLQRKKKKNISTDYNLQKGYFDEEGIYKYPCEPIRKTNVEILIDTSGSVDDRLVQAFIQDCKNIFKDCNIKIGCFDTHFYGFKTIKKKEDLDNFTIEGRGGTDFKTAIHSFNKNAQVKIIFTDGEAEIPDEKQDITWVVYGDIRINPPGGKVFYVDPNNYKVKGKSR